MKRLLIFALAVVFAGALAAPAIAGEVSILGRLCMETSLFNESEEVSPTLDSRTDSRFDLSKGAGVDIIYTLGDTKLVFGGKAMDMGKGNDFQMAVLFGTWEFAPGSTLILGHRSDIVLAKNPDQVLNNKWGLNSFGNAGGRKSPLVGYARKTGFGSFEIDLMWPVEEQPGAPGAMGGTTNGIIPRISASADFKVADAKITPSFSFNTFESEGILGGGDEDVQSYLAGVHFDWPLAMAKISGEAYYGQNVYIYSPTFMGPDYEPTLVSATDGSIDEDTAAYGGYLQLSFPIEPVTLNVGAGMGVADNDKKGTEDDVTRTGFFANIRYPFTENFFIQPEIVYFDNGDNFNGVDQGNVIFYGLYWQMGF